MVQKRNYIDSFGSYFPRDKTLKQKMDLSKSVLRKNLIFSAHLIELRQEL